MRIRIAESSAFHDVQLESSDRDEPVEDVTDPLSPFEEPDEPSDLDDFDTPCTDDDSRWDVFIPDDDEFDPLPERGDFWTTPE